MRETCNSKDPKKLKKLKLQKKKKKKNFFLRFLFFLSLSFLRGEVLKKCACVTEFPLRRGGLLGEGKGKGAKKKRKTN